MKRREFGLGLLAILVGAGALTARSGAASAQYFGPRGGKLGGRQFDAIDFRRSERRRRRMHRFFKMRRRRLVMMRRRRFGM